MEAEIQNNADGSHKVLKMLMMTMSKRRNMEQSKSQLSLTSGNEKSSLAKTKMLAANADELYDKFEDLAKGYNILAILTAIGMFTSEILRSIDDLEVRQYLCDIIVETVKKALDDEEEAERSTS
jgi:hypothetical protein